MLRPKSGGEDDNDLPVTNNSNGGNNSNNNNDDDMYTISNHDFNASAQSIRNDPNNTGHVNNKNNNNNSINPSRFTQMSRSQMKSLIKEIQNDEKKEHSNLISNVNSCSWLNKPENLKALTLISVIAIVLVCMNRIIVSSTGGAVGHPPVTTTMVANNNNNNNYMQQQQQQQQQGTSMLRAGTSGGGMTPGGVQGSVGAEGSYGGGSGSSSAMGAGGGGFAMTPHTGFYLPNPSSTTVAANSGALVQPNGLSAGGPAIGASGTNNYMTNQHQQQQPITSGQIVQQQQLSYKELIEQQQQMKQQQQQQPGGATVGSVVAPGTPGIATAAAAAATTSSRIPTYKELIEQQQMKQQQAQSPEKYGTDISTDLLVPKLNQVQQFKDAWDPWESTDHAVFFHIPRSGGSTIKDIIGGCHRKVLASEFGVTDGHEQDTEIAIVYPKGGEAGMDRSPFVNVDTTTLAGIKRAKRLGFADSQLADAVVTPFIYEANALFTDTAKGRLFTVFRHPIDRAISMFYYLQIATWEPTYKPELKDWTLVQYAQSDVVEDNWMTRQLSNALTEDVNDTHLKIAMEVIRRKFLVGLTTEMDRTMSRIEKFFHWKFRVNPKNQEGCRESLLRSKANANANRRQGNGPGSPEWEAFTKVNEYDLKLYEFIEKIFEEQEDLFSDGDDYRLVDSTCCKCNPPTYPPEGFECPKAFKNQN